MIEDAWKPVYRLAKQDSYCRVCDKVINRGEDYMVSWYSMRNRGQHIHVCPPCLKSLYELIPND